MGLIDKVKPKPKEVDGLSKEESEFILAKLRTATYKGEEFEMFYTIFKKIGEHIRTPHNRSYQP
jgi:hypothetical protein